MNAASLQPIHCGPGDPLARVLFLIKSAAGNEERRAAQHDRWLKDLPAGAEYYFCISGQTAEVPRVDGRRLLLPGHDGYDHLPAKMKRLAAWVAEESGWNHFDYVVTLDDDVVADTGRLYDFLRCRPDHFGNRWNGDPSHISGMFIGYSMKAFHIMAGVIGSIPDTGPDDLLLGRAVREPFASLNVMTDCDRFKPYGTAATDATIAVEIRPFRAETMRDYRFPESGLRRRVSFCLFGGDPKYCRGALANLDLVDRYYPGWEAVYHTRDVPAGVIGELRKQGATVVECAYANMMLARFLPFCEEGVVLSRDCDSRIGPREVRAVSEWLASDKPAHLIRDHPEHIPGWALIPGGLWGSRLPFGERLRRALEEALDDPRYSGWGGDQRWLVEKVWRADGFLIHQYDQVDWMRDSWKPDLFCGMRHEGDPPATTPREVVLFEGFFNRLNGLVNARLTHGPEFRARWALNGHLPHRFEDLFEPVPGMEVANEEGLTFCQENTDPAKGPLCYWFVSRRCGATAEAVAEAYHHYLSRLKITVHEPPSDLGIHYRGLHHSARVTAEEFARWCLAEARARGACHCFAIADSDREKIGGILEEGGMRVTWGRSAPLRNDLDRRDLEDLRAFIGDAMTLAGCATVLTSFAETTIVDPARALGREVIAHSGSRAWSECWFHHSAGCGTPKELPARTRARLKSPPGMKILIADVLLAGRPHADWKEGYELCYAFRNLGHECDVAGPHGSIPETRIPDIANEYDMVVITENYPEASGWKWWDWAGIRIPKLFWAIDTHLVDYRPWIRQAGIDLVAFNNPGDMEHYGLEDSFFMPYGASRRHYLNQYAEQMTRDLVFIGAMTPERRRLCEKFGIECISAFGAEYVREMQSSRICFNQSMSYDINAKYIDILASGSFMLANYNEPFHRFVDYREDIGRMFYHSEDDLGDKIRYYLEHEDERISLARTARDYIFKNHSWENRAQLILDNFEQMASRPTRLDMEYDLIRSHLDCLGQQNRARYLYGTHIEALRDVLVVLRPTPDEVLLEFGGGHFSTPLLLATGARVFTVEQGQNVPAETNEAWLRQLRETYQERPNWHLMDLPGITAWRDACYPPGALFCFVDGNGNCRKEVVEFMLASGLPVVAAHDSETLSFRYDQVAGPATYSVHDFRRSEVWTRVWSRNHNLTSMLDESPFYHPVGNSQETINLRQIPVCLIGGEHHAPRARHHRYWDRPDYAGLIFPHTNWTPSMSGGCAYGCSAAHLNAVTWAIAACKGRPVLLMENDAVQSEWFDPVLRAVPADADIIWLGCSNGIYQGRPSPDFIPNRNAKYQRLRGVCQASHAVLLVTESGKRAWLACCERAVAGEMGASTDLVCSIIGITLCTQYVLAQPLFYQPDYAATLLPLLPPSPTAP
jgi:hypothetical protein